MVFEVLFTTLKVSEPKQLLTLVKLVLVYQYRSINVGLEGWFIS